MLQKEKFNGRVLIFPLLEIEFQNISVNLERADILVFTSVYAVEKLNIELKNSETPIFAVGQRCDDSLKVYCNNKRPTIFYLRGDEISFDLKADLSKYNFNCEEYVVYKQKRPIQQRELDNVLARKHLEGIALFSEKSVDSLTKGASENNLNKIFFCFSKKIENRLRSVLDKDIRCKTTQEPLISEMVKMIVKEYARY